MMTLWLPHEILWWHSCATVIDMSQFRQGAEAAEGKAVARIWYPWARLTKAPEPLWLLLLFCRLLLSPAFRRSIFISL